MSSSPPPELDRVQRWMQAVISHPDGVLAGADGEAARELIDAGRGKLESVVTRSRALSASDRLAIYGNAYYARLIECLGDVYPVLRRTLGEETFDSFAFEYLQGFPSTSYTLNPLGERFGTFLDQTRPEPESKSGAADTADTADWADFLIDLARLEWTIYEIFDGPGIESEPPLNVVQLLQRDPEEIATTPLATAPCLRLLTTAYPVNAFYTEVRRTEDELSLPSPEPGVNYLAITRRDFIVRRYELSAPQFALLEALQAGKPLGGAIEAAADMADKHGIEMSEGDLGQWFQYWAAERCFFQSS